MLFLILIAVSLGLLIFGIWIMRKDSDYDLLGFTLVLVFGVCLLCFVLAIPMTHLGWNQIIREYHSLERTIEDARVNEISDVERATLTVMIAEMNVKVAEGQYWANHPWFYINYPSELLELKPLR